MHQNCTEKTARSNCIVFEMGSRTDDDAIFSPLFFHFSFEFDEIAKFCGSIGIGEQEIFAARALNALGTKKVFENFEIELRDQMGRRYKRYMDLVNDLPNAQRRLYPDFRSTLTLAPYSFHAARSIFVPLQPLHLCYRHSPQWFRMCNSLHSKIRLLRRASMALLMETNREMKCRNSPDSNAHSQLTSLFLIVSRNDDAEINFWIRFDGRKSFRFFGRRIEEIFLLFMTFDDWMRRRNCFHANENLQWWTNKTYHCETDKPNCISISS